METFVEKIFIPSCISLMELCLDMFVEVLTIDGFRTSGAVVGVKHSL